jgi:hypothetical protein
MPISKTTAKTKEPGKVLLFFNTAFGVIISIITAVGIGVGIGLYAKGQQAQI